jgi:hypothetical protein
MRDLVNSQEANKDSDFSEALLKRFKQEVEDAKLLLEYAVSTGYTTEDKGKVPDKIVDVINAMEDLLRKVDVPPHETPSAEQRAVFEKAYRDLAELLAPVTAYTLKFTSYDPKYSVRFLFMRVPEAVVWSRKLAIITLLFVIGSILGDLYIPVKDQFAPPLDGTWPNNLTYYLFVFLNNAVPFTFGGIGSCAYLLRACHQYIVKRQFDKVYIPEYYNRILLGMISGGSIMLFVSEIGTDKNSTVHLSSAALGFLAGYNTDFLFSAVERIIQAILPKVALRPYKRPKANLSK